MKKQNHRWFLQERQHKPEIKTCLLSAQQPHKAATDNKKELFCTNEPEGKIGRSCAAWPHSKTALADKNEHRLCSFKCQHIQWKTKINSKCILRALPVLPKSDVPQMSTVIYFVAPHFRCFLKDSLGHQVCFKLQQERVVKCIIKTGYKEKHITKTLSSLFVFQRNNYIFVSCF